VSRGSGGLCFIMVLKLLAITKRGLERKLYFEQMEIIDLNFNGVCEG